MARAGQYYVTSSTGLEIDYQNGSFTVTPDGSTPQSISGGGSNYMDYGHPGLALPQWTPGGSITTNTMTAARCWLHRFVAPRAMAITLAAFPVTAAASVNDSTEFAIYNSALNSQLGTTGLVAGQLNAGAPAIKTFNFVATVNLIAGTVYYAAWSIPIVGGTAASNINISLTNVLTSQLFGATIPSVDCANISGIVTALPNDISGQTISPQLTAPLWAIRES